MTANRTFLFLTFLLTLFSLQLRADQELRVIEKNSYLCRYCYLRENPRYIFVSDGKWVEFFEGPNPYVLNYQATKEEIWRVYRELTETLGEKDDDLPARCGINHYQPETWGTHFGYFIEKTCKKFEIQCKENPDILPFELGKYFSEFLYAYYFRQLVPYSVLGAKQVFDQFCSDFVNQIQLDVNEWERKFKVGYEDKKDRLPSEEYQWGMNYYFDKISRLEDYINFIKRETSMAASRLIDLVSDDMRFCLEDRAIRPENHFDHFINPFDLCYADFLKGNYFEFLEGIKGILAEHEGNDQVMLTAGEAYSELGLYTDAISYLSKAIRANPENKDAYFERAIAYFELGDFDQALEDYILSDVKPISFQEASLATLEFAGGLIKGASYGASHSIENFVPSMLCSLQGLANGLWSFALDPKEVSKDMVQACKNLYEFIQDQSALETLRVLVPELDELIGGWSEHSEFKKGELIGTIVGKYGTDVFLCSGSVKAVKLCKDLQKANGALTLNTMKNPEYLRVIREGSSRWKKTVEGPLEEIKHSRKLAKELGEKFSGVNLTENEVRKMLHNVGCETFSVPKGMDTNDFFIRISDNGGGMRYIHKTKEGFEIRVMPGNPNSTYASQHQAYVVHKTKSGLLDKKGNSVPRKGDASHIPLEEYDFSVFVEALENGK